MENVQTKRIGRMDKKTSKIMEIEGVDVEDAIRKALELLKVSREEIYVKVVCEEKKGLYNYYFILFNIIV